MNIKLLVLSSLFFTFIISCKKDDEPMNESVGVNFSQGVWIANEGSFGNLNASITHISESGVITSDPFMSANGVGIGDVLQDVEEHNGLVYAVVNNSQKIEIFNASDFKIVDQIEGIDYPRDIVFNSNRAYVSCGAFAGEVKVIDLTNNSIINSITVGNGPEQMVIQDDFLYVCNSGGWSVDNSVSVIDLSTESVVETIVVGDRPVDIDLDVNGNIWVLSSGETLYDIDWNVIGHTNAYLNQISPVNILLNQYAIGENGDHPRSFDISFDGSEVLVVNGEVWSAEIIDLSTTWSILVDGNFNTVDCDSESGDFWLTSMPDFVTNSTVYHVSGGGTILSEVEAGIGAHSVRIRH